MTSNGNIGTVSGVVIFLIYSAGEHRHRETKEKEIL